MASVVRLLALALAWTGLAALLPALVSLNRQEGLAPVFLATTLACIFLAGAMHFASAGLGGRARRLDIFAALAGLWLLIPVVAAPSIALASNLSLPAAWFEALSAFTTTGFSALGAGPRSLFVWLCVLQWSGGLLTIVAGLAVLAPAGIGGLPDRAVHRLDERDAVDIKGALKDAAPIYLGAFVLAFIALLLAGNSVFSAFCLASAVTSSGGHLPPEAKEAIAAGEATRWVMLPFFLWAATSVRWHQALVSRRIHAAPEQSESLVLVAYWLVTGVAMAALYFNSSGTIGTVTALSDGLFAAASLISTSGLAPAPGAFSVLPHGLLLLVALVGGGSLSVAGGLKILRVRALVLRTRADLTRLVSPNIVQPSRTGEGGLGSAMRGVWVGTVALFAMLGLALVTIAAGAPSFEAALTAAVAATTNTGPLYDAAGQGWPALSTYPAISMIGAAFAMVAGRIEIIGAFVLIHLAFWRT